MKHLQHMHTISSSSKSTSTAKAGAPLATALPVIPTILMAVLLTTACSGKPDGMGDEAAAPHTGAIDIENQVGALSPSQARAGAVVYVYAERLNVRSSPEVPAEGGDSSSNSNLVGALEMNDKVEIVDPQPIGSSRFVAIRVVESRTPVPKDQTLYVSLQHLNGSARQFQLEGNVATASKIFIVTNIATEKTRVYQRCEPWEGCVNKMLFEQDVVVGEDDRGDGLRTDVGTYRVTSWEKFYETPGKYPAWYKEGYPNVPPPGSRRDWFSSSHMPDGQGEMRGAFGWYTMKVGPNPNGQWMHGTAGWGQDKKSFIKFKDSFWGGIVSLFTNLGSHGCTRIDNESITYLRSKVPVGATYVKIYAKEGSRAPYPAQVSTEPGQWAYIMTKNGGGVTNNHQLADRDLVLSTGTTSEEMIEEGVLDLDQTPTPVTFKGDDTYNLYDVPEKDLVGYFLVDEGTVIGYQHPPELGVGGFADRQLPSFMVTEDDSTYYAPSP